jgi:hypothetical protein
VFAASSELEKIPNPKSRQKNLFKKKKKKKTWWDPLTMRVEKKIKKMGHVHDHRVSLVQ